MAARWFLVAVLVAAPSLFAQTADHKITGSVVDIVTKSPIGNASILLSSGPDSALKQGGKTDAAGRFSIPKLTAGSYRLLATATGYAPQLYGAPGPQQMGTELIVAGTKDPDIVIELYPGGDVKGRVVDEDGAAIPGATVELLNKNVLRGGVERVTIGSRTSGSDGDYVFQSVTPGRYYLRIRRYPQLSHSQVRHEKPDCLPNVLYYPGAQLPEGATAFTVFSGQPTDLGKLKLARGECRAVNVRLEHAPSLVDVALVPGEAFGLGEPPTQTAMTRVDENVIQFPGISPGDYVLVLDGASDSKRPPQSRHIRVGDGDVNLVVRMDSGSITGKLQGLESNLPTEMILESVEFLDGKLTAPVNADGTFAFSAVKEGNYFLAPRTLPNGVSISSIAFNGAPMKGHRLHHSGIGAMHLTVNLQCCGSTVSGSVDDDGKHFERPVLVVLLPESLDDRLPENMQMTLTGINGAFSFASVPPGRYKAIATDNLGFGRGIDPEFASRYETSGTPVDAGEHGTAGIKVRLIRVPAE